LDKVPAHLVVGLKQQLREVLGHQSGSGSGGSGRSVAFDELVLLMLPVWAAVDDKRRALYSARLRTSNAHSHLQRGFTPVATAQQQREQEEHLKREQRQGQQSSAPLEPHSAAPLDEAITEAWAAFASGATVSPPPSVAVDTTLFAATTNATTTTTTSANESGRRECSLLQPVASSPPPLSLSPPSSSSFRSLSVALPGSRSPSPSPQSIASSSPTSVPVSPSASASSASSNLTAFTTAAPRVSAPVVAVPRVRVSLGCGDFESTSSCSSSSSVLFSATTTAAIAAAGGAGGAGNAAAGVEALRAARAWSLAQATAAATNLTALGNREKARPLILYHPALPNAAATAAYSPPVVVLKALPPPLLAASSSSPRASPEHPHRAQSKMSFAATHQGRHTSQPALPPPCNLGDFVNETSGAGFSNSDGRSVGDRSILGGTEQNSLSLKPPVGKCQHSAPEINESEGGGSGKVV